ncbi:MAG: HpcH/HpaI aldolase/citrate lyase family protein [Paracoccaceae bacterium]
MSLAARPYRSVLYIPGSNDRALEKARSLPADALIFDLEDAVAVDEKLNARVMAADAIRAGGYGPRARLVRVNGLDTQWGREDVAAYVGIDIDGMVLPKVGSAADADVLAALIPAVPIWAMMESPLGILNAVEIAAHPRVAGLIMGTNDLGHDLGGRQTADRAPLVLALQTCLLAARAHRLVCLDGVYNAFRDTDGLRGECEQGRDMGFDGKTLIHPAQVAVANSVFGPTSSEVEMAKRQIAAFEDAAESGKGVAVVDGRIVEILHAETARATLAKVAAIATMEG